jgi:pimeloyl-ACP methyl ester carboxylesterase
LGTRLQRASCHLSANRAGLARARQINQSIEGIHIPAIVSRCVRPASIERFKAIGLSMGAKTLLHLATQQPARVEAMVLVSATPYFPEQARAIMRQLSPDDHTEAEWRQMREWHKHGDEQIRALWRLPEVYKDSYTDMNFTPPYLSTIMARTLIVHGDRDPLYPVNLALEMYGAIPRSYLWIIPNGGHGPIFGDMAGHFVETSLAFLQGDWERAA